MLQNKYKLITSSYVIMLVILLGLGFWQLNRLQEKRQYIRQVYHALQDTKAIGIDSAQDKYQKVLLEGRPDCQNLMWLYRRYPTAKAKQGSYVMLPVRYGESSVLTILGWTEDANKDALRQKLCAIETINLEGILIDSEKKIFLVPGNDLERNIYFTVDVPQIAQRLPYSLKSFYLAAIDYDLDKLILPISAQIMISVRNDHLEYAVTWFIFAGILTLFYFKTRREWPKQ